MLADDAARELRKLLTALPKIELHRHLEGSLRLSTLAELARQYNLDVPAYDVDGLRPHVQIMPDSPATAAHFLSKFVVLRKFYVSPDVISRFVHECIADASADNVRYMELRFTPKALARVMNFPFSDVIEWVTSAALEAQTDTGTRVKLIVSLNRHESLTEAEEIVRAALDHKDRGIVGLDLAGPELGYPANPFAGLFREARHAGLQVTIHAAEWDGPENIRFAIEHLGAARIGHGVRILEDASIVALARERGTIFEVCPTSNYHSGVISALTKHPLPAMHAAGLAITLNTDDPSLSNITLSDELYNAKTLFQFGLGQIQAMILNAATCAFLPETERLKLTERLRAALSVFPTDG
jgi:adenosine deaminase